jgi:hypothetical protein
MTTLHMVYNARENLGMPNEVRSVANTGFDSTSMGGAIIRQQLEHIVPKRPLNFAGKTKIKALTNLRAALSRGDLMLPPTWSRVQREVFGYRLDDAKIVQDCVMALTGAAFLASQGTMGPNRAPFRYGYRTVAGAR